MGRSQRTKTTTYLPTYHSEQRPYTKREYHIGYIENRPTEEFTRSCQPVLPPALFGFVVLPLRPPLGPLKNDLNASENFDITPPPTGVFDDTVARQLALISPKWVWKTDFKKHHTIG